MVEQFSVRQIFEWWQKLKLKHFNCWIVIWMSNYLFIFKSHLLILFNCLKILFYQNFAIASLGHLIILPRFICKNSVYRSWIFLSLTLHDKPCHCWTYFIRDLISSNGGKRKIGWRFQKPADFWASKFYKNTSKYVKLLKFLRFEISKIFRSWFAQALLILILFSRLKYYQ